MREILIFDSSTLKGHHEIYLRRFLSILMGEGYQVYLFCEDNSYIIQTLEESQKELCKPLEIRLSILEKAICKSFLLIDQTVAKLFPSFPGSYFSSLTPLICTKNLQKQTGKQIPVFFLHADSVLPRVPLWLTKLTSIFPKTWCSFYVQPLYPRNLEINSKYIYWKLVEEKKFSLQSCKSALLLDPSYVKSFNEEFNDLRSIYLPEISNTEVGKVFPLVSEVLEAANNRKIISIIGSLLPKRNLILFLEAVIKLPQNHFFILIVGSMPTHLYSRKELDRIETLSKQLDKNSYIRTNYYIPEEEEFNALMRISDLIYLQYKKHPYSSNILAKSINLKKPVIVNTGYLMEQIVQRYDWQAVVPEDPNQVAESIEYLTSNFKVNEESYNRFISDHSEESFKVAVLEAVEALSLSY